MKLLFIRHGDPDYVKDSLTEKGKVEAALLADTIENYGIDEVYMSPLGRAKDTAAYSLEKLGMEAEIFDWLMEFPAGVDPNLSADAREAYATDLKRTESGEWEKRIVWDMLPSYFAKHPELFDRNGWRESELLRYSNMLPVYDHVQASFFQFLEKQGYKKEGDVFHTDQGNEKTIAFFCHFGITAVLLSMLCNVSPFVFLQYLVMAPTSVTEVVTEEREKGTVFFRTLRIGDISHLRMGGEEPSFAARFCETFERTDQRH